MNKIYLYPIWIRVWHLINALMCLLLILSGMSMQFSSLENPFINFRQAVALHNIGGITLSISYLIFFTGNIIYPNGKFYKIEWKGLGTRLKNQFTYYSFGIFQSKTPPYPITADRKFNPLQQVSYVTVMYFLVPVLILTGIGLLFPGLIVNAVIGNKGLFVADLLHVICGFLVSLFMIVHIYFCTIGYRVSSHFKAMATGYHEVH